MKYPKSTYRIQFHKGFNFSQFEHTIDYLERIGIDTIYASPILGAVAGSVHGYDGTDMQRINPEIGTLDQFRKIRKRLQKKAIKWIQDIVPNHMAFHPENAWLMDVLQYGQASRYSTYFDTLYTTSYLTDQKLMVPVLGDTLDQTLKSGDIQIIRHSDLLRLQYHDQQWPLSPTSYTLLLSDIMAQHIPDPENNKKRIAAIEANGADSDWSNLRKKIFERLNTQGQLPAVDEVLLQWNNHTDQLAELIAHQHYLLCHWQETDRRINYRRFFTVNGLICMQVQSPAVFEDSHRFIRQLINENLVDGIRVDHIDGLYDPTAYLMQLRHLVGPDVYIVVEKILEQHEPLPSYWPIQGTTGYEFLANSQNVAVDTRGYSKLQRYYERKINPTQTIAQEQLAKKQNILAEYMQGELDNLVHYFKELDLEASYIHDDDLKATLGHFLCYFPVYRLYDTTFPMPTPSFQLLMSVFDAIAQDQVAPADNMANFRSLFYLAQHREDISFRNRVSLFLSRCMQFTGPLMAKGVEDTLMYTYNGFMAQNEVGNHPENSGIRAKAYHRWMMNRQLNWPKALNATATHDTKRGEDARSRLNVLSACPEKWIAQVKVWEDLLTSTYTGTLPHINDRYALYQALYASYPMPGASDVDFETRLQAYLVKYLREGKMRSSWTSPQETYESAMQHFAHFLLDKKKDFFLGFDLFLQSTADLGIVNSLTQLVLKFTSPGIPDIYQGTELWDLSFVDPDNRRPVDYALRKEYLSQIQNIPTKDGITSLWKERYDGKIKLWLMHRLLTLRQQHPALDVNGQYSALKVKGRYRKHVLAFARLRGDECIVTVVPLHMAGIQQAWNTNLTDLDWADTRVILPKGKVHTWTHLLHETKGTGAELALTEIFRQLPIAVIRCQEVVSRRQAGVLLSLTSLPSKYGIGDLGKSSFLFVYQLHMAQQDYWQVLPWNPTSAAQLYSPYSTCSAMAGNPLLISLDTLRHAGLLRRKECKKAEVANSDRVDYAQVERTKMALLDKAYARTALEHDKEFQQFCQEEAYWLDDYALYAVIRQHYQQPWYHWPVALRKRNKKTLSDFAKNHGSAIQKEKWIQHIFFQQWRDLQHYTQKLGINLLGDVPFYASLDSADVWAHPAFFALTPDGQPEAVAGVPPDYFNTDGQLWGMPVFDWKTLKRHNYSWWIDRLRHHSKLFDQVRLDHFRAFEAFWAVPAEESSAQKGQWKPGPGTDFFDRLREAIPHMPFIAEDLGDIDEAVYQLRDRYRLAGMKVLQFAFGNDMPHSPHIPHQYGPHDIVYTGTHDNNTLQGWYHEELDQESKQRVSSYMGIYIGKDNVNEHLIRLAYSSVAKLVILPIQDILCLDSCHRMNSPASTENNWIWRMRPHAFDKKHQKKLRKLTLYYNR